MTKIDSKGMIAGGLVWLALMAMMAAMMACVDARSCGGEDFVLYGFMGVGMFGPAYIVAAIISR